MGLLFFIFGTIGDKLSQLPGGYFAKSTIFETQSANRNLSPREAEGGRREGAAWYVGGSVNTDCLLTDCIQYNASF